MMLSALLALLSGGTIVMNRMLNADAGTRIGVWPSTAINYITGLLTSFVVLLCLRAGFTGALSAAWFLYTGGLIGVAAVALSSYSAPHLPAFLMTLLLFVSQFVAGMVIDGLLGRPTPALRAVGAGIVLVGLLVYVMGERKAT